MNIAIYARKSRITDKGESIYNQINMCKNYASTNFENPVFFIYKDEGFSGGNTDRPQFQHLLKELKKGTYNILMCYRLDRISRNVSDFSSTLALLNKRNIGFVSIKENFDTTTPMGRAMIHISSVFAQLERETIAERVRDNMHELACTGRWLGGAAPTGFIGEKELYLDDAGQKKTMVKLSPVPNEQELVKLIFKKYLELGSLSQVETFCIQHGIKSKNNKRLQPQTISLILQNPVYCIADNKAYKYFKKLGVNIPDSEKNFDGKYGIMPYNRHKNGKHYKKKDYNEWVIAIGNHKGLISSQDWINVQIIINKNKNKSIRTESPTNALLSGILYCAKCNSKMLVVNQSFLADGTPSYSYKCRIKHISKGANCKIPNISGHYLDKYILTELENLTNNRAELFKLLINQKSLLDSEQHNIDKEILKLETTISKNEASIKALVVKLAELDSNTAIPSYIQKEIILLDDENKNLKSRILELGNYRKFKDCKNINFNTIESYLFNFNKLIDNKDIISKRMLINNLIRKIEWDGNKIDIYMNINKTND